jgi:hypothetical protein
MNRRPRGRALTTCIGAICVALALVACSAKTDDEHWLAHVESANEQADRLVAEGRQSEARDVLRDAEAALRLSGSADAHMVRRDLLYRLAHIELASGNAKAAADWATRGLALGRPNDAFTTNLLIVRGRAFEQMNDPAGASRDYHDALVITEALLDRTLEGSSP